MPQKKRSARPTVTITKPVPKEEKHICRLPNRYGYGIGTEATCECGRMYTLVAGSSHRRSSRKWQRGDLEVETVMTERAHAHNGRQRVAV